MFERDGGGIWAETAKLTASSEEFGYSVAVGSDTLLVGVRALLGTDPGAAYVFEPVLVSPDLSISGACPGESTLIATGVSPRHRVRIYDADSPGSHILETGPCAGTVLDLEQPLANKQTCSGRALVFAWK